MSESLDIPPPRQPNLIQEGRPGIVARIIDRMGKLVVRLLNAPSPEQQHQAIINRLARVYKRAARRGVPVSRMLPKVGIDLGSTGTNPLCEGLDEDRPDAA